MSRAKTKITDPSWYAPALRHARRVIIAVVGFTIIVIGIILIFFPGPAFLVIPLGLLVLGTEFVWARRLLKRIKEKSGIEKTSVWKKFRAYFRKK